MENSPIFARHFSRRAMLLGTLALSTTTMIASASPGHATVGGDIDFAWCDQCMALHRRYDADIPHQLCPAGGNHSYPYPTSGMYYLPCNTQPPSQSQGGWSRCARCSVLFYLGSQNRSTCMSTGQRHDPSGSYDYFVFTTPSTGRQAGWRWCDKCMAMFYFGAGNLGCCPVYSPATAWGHDPSGSGSYFIYNFGNEGWVGARRY